MPATVVVNKLTVVHKTSGGVVMTFPDVCKTPSPAGPIPLPYPNVALSADTADGSASVKADGNPIMLKTSNFATSTGDEAGSAGGIVSNKIKGKAYPRTYSFDVKVEGQPVLRLTDLMVTNAGSPPNGGGVVTQAAAPAAGGSDPEHRKVTKIEWSKEEACCGDEVLLTVEGEDLANMPVPIVVSQSGKGIVCGTATVDMQSNEATYRWLVTRGPWSRDVRLTAEQMLWDGVQKSRNEIEVKTIPDSKKPISRKQWAWVYVKKKNDAGEAELDPAGDPIYEHDQKSWAEWDVTFEMEVRSGKFTVTKKVQLVPVGGATVSSSEERRWKRQIEGIWNRFKLHRVSCERGNDCSCGRRSSGCCMFPINIVCEFAPGPGDSVNLHRGKNAREGFDVPVRLESGALNPDWPKWWYSHEWWEGLENVPRTVRAHEFGHLIGMYDEYLAGAVKSVKLPHGIVRFHENVPDSIMSRGGIVYRRHVEEFQRWFESQAEPVVGELELLSIR
jgi:hypothetical protein